MNPILNKLEHFYKTLQPDALHCLADIYDKQVRFVDPVGQHQGLEQVQHYFANLLRSCQTCRFDLHTQHLCGDIAYIHWTMYYAHPRLKGATLLSIEGISEIHLGPQRIVYQRDYYDLGAMLYEHLPLLGPLVKWLKRRLAV